MSGLLKFDSTAKSANVTLDQDDIRALSSSDGIDEPVRANLSISATDKVYWHIKNDGLLGDEHITDTGTGRYGGFTSLGVVNAAHSLASGVYIGESIDSLGWGLSTGLGYYNSSSGTGAPALNTLPSFAGTTLSFAVDAGVIYVAVNNLWRNAMDPQAGTGGYTLPFTGDWYPAVSMRNLNARAIIDGLTRIPSLDAAGYRPLGVDSATITFAAGSIKDNSDANATETGANYDVFSAAGIWLASGTVNISGGGATLNFVAAVVNAQKVRVSFSKWDGTTLGENFNYGMEAIAVVV